jgi:hypothetical protein
MSTREPQFPVSSFREAAQHLRRPFTPEAVKFKVQATWPKDAPTGGLVVAYIDARLAVERLNLIVPDRWSDHYEPAAWLGKDSLLCHLTVDGITRTDVGEGKGKGLISDALKRAAVKFGVGVSLYAIPKMQISIDSGQAQRKQTRDGLTLVMTARGESDMRAIYRLWLERHGAQAFGEPLDHGDVADAAGDPEEPTAVEEEAATAPVASTNGASGLPDETVRALATAKKEADLPPERLRLVLASIGVDDVPERVTLATIKRLTPAQAEELLAILNTAIDERVSA